MTPNRIELAANGQTLHPKSRRLTRFRRDNNLGQVYFTEPSIIKD